MNARFISRAAIDATLKLARLPLELASTALPGNGAGPQGRARVAIDRADAMLRSLAGRLTLDPELREDARLRLRASDERRRAVSLREQADRVTGAAGERVEETHARSQSRRRTAEERAQAERQQARRRRSSRQRSAAEKERERVQAARREEQREQEQIDELAPRARLDALKEREEASEETRRALTESDEARRLEKAAARVKAERKSEV